ncbi:MAG: C25 family cysteine peptidase, partial [Thermoplasmatota archaeon]
ITPKKFQNIVQKLVDHKNNFGVKTILKTTQEIYDEYNGLDEPEKIKYFIKDALETWGIKYVLFFGGLKSTIYGKPKDDINHGSIGWYFPVRYSNFQYDGDPSYNFTSDEPGYLCDLYYADIYKEGGVFDNWDSNGNGVFGEWSGEIKDEMDLYPDVAFGRLACTSTKEAKDVVNKIINYEKEPADPLWFNRIIVVSGDGFLDQKDLNIQWDTKGLPDGKYTIFAQASNPDGEKGPINQINITLNKLVETNITFNHDDHLTTGLKYPFPPVAEIVSISEGNILGNTDYTYTPNEGQAYCNDLFWWANISYVDGVLTIRGKSYDPRPYGNLTNLEVWIKNEQGTIVFNDTRINLETYYEGEWVVGEKVLHGRGGALTFMPEYFENNSVFTSNGKWFNQLDVIREFSNGYGLAYFSGHGSPGWWGDHYPGIPGNRRYGQVPGLLVTQFLPYFPFIKFPLLPMKKLSNTNKLPVVCVGGCHNSMFNVSLIPTILNLFIINYMFTYGHPLPECWGWYMVKLPKTGAIATMGNTGFGWGSEGDVCTIGPGDGWLNTEFFRVYGQENQSILGLAYTQAISNYITNFKTFQYQYWRNDTGWDGIDHKTVTQWQLLGDPSLKIGGYS